MFLVVGCFISGVVLLKVVYFVVGAVGMLFVFGTLVWLLCDGLLIYLVLFGLLVVVIICFGFGWVTFGLRWFGLLVLVAGGLCFVVVGVLVFVVDVINSVVLSYRHCIHVVGVVIARFALLWWL